MATTAYTDNQVFTTPLANVYCNAIITSLQQEENDGLIINSVFALTGSAARIIQGQEAAEVQNIAFITSSLFVFNFLSSNIKTILPAVDVIRREGIIQFKASGFYFEIHLASQTRTINNVDGVYVQDINEIPNYIL